MANISEQAEVNELRSVHLALAGVAADFRDEVCKATGWDYRKFYNKVTDKSGRRTLTDIEVEKVEPIIRKYKEQFLQ